MSDTKMILDSARALQRSGQPFLVATVVRVCGSSYRRPGARMLLTGDRWVAGSVSGGCLEGDVVKRGWWRMREGKPVIVRYDASVHDEVRAGFGLGCDGIVDVLIERAGESDRLDPFTFIAGCIASQQRGALATVLGQAQDRVEIGARLALRADGTRNGEITDERVRARILDECLTVLAEGQTRVVTRRVDGADVDVLIEAILPPPRLFILGTGHDAVPVATFARALGWEVIVWEPHARFATRERFAGADLVFASDVAEVAARIDGSNRAAAVVMGHDYERDRASLCALLGSRVRYIGVLGPRRRTGRMLADLQCQGEDPRIHAPVGLALGAETPEEIALAITAEIQSVLAHASAASLRERAGTIHEPLARADAAE